MRKLYDRFMLKYFPAFFYRRIRLFCYDVFPRNGVIALALQLLKVQDKNRRGLYFVTQAIFPLPYVPPKIGSFEMHKGWTLRTGQRILLKTDINTVKSLELNAVLIDEPNDEIVNILRCRLRQGPDARFVGRIN